MNRIVDLYLVDFGNFAGEVELDLRHPKDEHTPNDQLLGILGSNGAGKSTLLEAIRWCITGVSRSTDSAGRGAGTMIREGAASTRVRVVIATRSGGQLTIDRSWSKSLDLAVILDAKQFHGKPAVLQERIYAELGVDEKTLALAFDVRSAARLTPIGLANLLARTSPGRPLGEVLKDLHESGIDRAYVQQVAEYFESEATMTPETFTRKIDSTDVAAAFERAREERAKAHSDSRATAARVTVPVTAEIVAEAHRQIGVLEAQLNAAQRELAEADGIERKVNRLAEISTRLGDWTPPAALDLDDRGTILRQTTDDAREALATLREKAAAAARAVALIPERHDGPVACPSLCAPQACPILSDPKKQAAAKDARAKALADLASFADPVNAAIDQLAKAERALAEYDAEQAEIVTRTKLFTERESLQHEIAGRQPRAKIATTVANLGAELENRREDARRLEAGATASAAHAAAKTRHDRAVAVADLLAPGGQVEKLAAVSREDDPLKRFGGIVERLFRGRVVPVMSGTGELTLRRAGGDGSVFFTSRVGASQGTSTLSRSELSLLGAALALTVAGSGLLLIDDVEHLDRTAFIALLDVVAEEIAAGRIGTAVLAGVDEGGAHRATLREYGARVVDLG